MLCTKCGKRPAAVHMKQRLNGQEIEEYLCEECAESLWSFGTLDLNKLFSSHFAAPRSTLTCPGCGMSLADFNNSGRLGCSQCYQSFASQPLPIINKFHGVKRHVGKVKLTGNSGGGEGPAASEAQLLQNPELANKNYEKLALQRQLNELVAVEKFEEAAAVRDKIRALEQEINAALTALETEKRAGEAQ